jgi:triosephosphate isomerase
MRRKLIAANWKMNCDLKESEILIRELTSVISKYILSKVDLVICPPFTSFNIVSKFIKESTIKLGAQNMFYESEGAFTGEVSAKMLKSAECEYVIIGHSERRKFFFESDESVNKKIKQALKFNLKPILCVGERIEERDDGIFDSVIEAQLERCLEDFTDQDISELIIAYEPIWAIGTGKNASPGIASEMHIFIRSYIENKFSNSIAENVKILYGGSVNEKNSSELLSEKDIDGLLIGGASLNAAVFNEIVRSAFKNSPKLNKQK